jgi:sulfite exporter TauE/SafE
MNLWLIFLTGLTTGGLSCLAVQGGLLGSVIANQKEQELAEKMADSNRRRLDKFDWLPVAMFLVAKLIVYTLLGFLLGALGSVITLSLGVRLAFQVFTALFMFATAMNLLNVHPIFRYLAFQPPKFVRKMVKNSSQSKAIFAPFVLGLMTVFIPCGVTQAMEVLAINTGNPVAGALIMFAFVLGTSPLFAILGVAAARLSETWHRQFTKVAAYALIGMMIYSLNGVLVVINSPLTLQKITAPIAYFFSEERFARANTTGAAVAPIENGVQQVAIGVSNQGYTPRYIQVKKDVPVKLTLTSNGVYSCASAFVFRKFNIQTFLEPVDRETFTFTPTETGKFAFTCSMGMYSGVMEVI